MFEKIKNWFLNNILTILTIILPICGSVFTAIRGYLSGTLTSIDIILFSFLLIIVVSLIIKGIWNKVSYKSYRYPWLKIRTSYNYELLDKTVTYKRDDSDVLHYSRSINIKCHSNRINHAYDKYIWTGLQNNSLNIMPISGISSIQNKSRIGIWHYFEMELQNHLVKGDTRVLSYKWPEISECTKSSPFFSASTDEPTKKLTLFLDLGSEYAGQEIICEEFRAIESDYPISISVENLDEHGTYTWNVPNIKRFRHYRIRWSWVKGQPAAEIE